MAGHHIRFINKGVLGLFSKIEEEFNEFKDAHEQQSTIMELVELADLIGATIAFYRKNYELFLLRKATKTFFVMQEPLRIRWDLLRIRSTFFKNRHFLLE